VTVAPPTANERMALSLSRRLGPGRIIVGAASAIPITAVLYAKDVQGMSIDWVCSGTGFVNPTPAQLYPSSTQFEYRDGATSVLPYHEIATLFERGFDYAFFGGLEVDGGGRLNTTTTSSGAMGPGPAGLPVGMAKAKNVLIYMTRHHPRALVEQVSHVTGRPSGNVRAIITPLAEFEMGGEQPELVRVLSGTPDEVAEATGFAYTTAEGSLDQEVTDDELMALRAIDRSGRLR
jgi:acyl CoA:acetate/3-ketoacid CoA transferase beta subunit